MFLIDDDLNEEYQTKIDVETEHFFMLFLADPKSLSSSPLVLPVTLIASISPSSFITLN